MLRGIVRKHTYSVYIQYANAVVRRIKTFLSAEASDLFTFYYVIVQSIIYNCTAFNYLLVVSLVDLFPRRATSKVPQFTPIT